MVTVVPRRNVTIIVNSTNPSQISAQSVTPTMTTEVQRLDQLVDVLETSPENGSVPIYNANTDKYIVSRLTLSDLDENGILDGGEF